LCNPSNLNTIHFLAGRVCWKKEQNFKRYSQFHTRKFWITAELVGESSINRKSGFLTRNLIFFLWVVAWKVSFLLVPQNVRVPYKDTSALPKKIKLGSKIVDCIFRGYALNSSAYNFLVCKSEIPNIYVNMIIESRDDVFFENVFLYERKEDKIS